MNTNRIFSRRSIILSTGLLTVLVSAASSSGQTAPSFKFSYDRFKDSNTLTLQFHEVIRKPSREVEFDLIQFSSGQKREGKRGKVTLWFTSDSSKGWAYLSFHPITLLVDGERMRFDPDHDGSVGNGYVLEQMDVDLSDSQLQKLLVAKQVEGQIGIDEFRLDRNQIAALHEFGKLLSDAERPIPRGPFVASPPPRPIPPSPLPKDQETQKREASESYLFIQEQMQAKQKREFQLKLEQNLRNGKSLEKTNPRVAIKYYQEVIKIAPTSPEAETAKAKLKALGVKSDGS